MGKKGCCGKRRQQEVANFRQISNTGDIGASNFHIPLIPPRITNNQIKREPTGMKNHINGQKIHGKKVQKSS